MRAAKVQARLRGFRRACAYTQSRQNLSCSVIQAVNQEELSDRKPDPWPLWMAGHAQLKFVMTECSKTHIRLTGLIISMSNFWWRSKTAFCLKYLLANVCADVSFSHICFIFISAILEKVIQQSHKEYSCRYCSKTFQFRSQLALHEIIHTGEKPYSCDVCGKSFNRRNNLKVHQLTHFEDKFW